MQIPLDGLMDRYELRHQDYSLSEDQESVRDAFSVFFTKESPSSVVRAAEPLGFDEALWQKLVNMGVTSMSLPSAVGGDDATLVDLVLITEELGRTVAPVPLISHVIATRLLAAAGADSGVIEAAIAGDQPFTVALQPQTSGSRQLVPDAAIAQDVVVLEDGSLVLYRGKKPSAHVPNQGCTPLGWWEPSSDAERVVLAEGPAAARLHRRAVVEWTLLTAAALVGMTEAYQSVRCRAWRSRWPMSPLEPPVLAT
jgi:hypothetical protein